MSFDHLPSHETRPRTSTPLRSRSGSGARSGDRARAHVWRWLPVYLLLGSAAGGLSLPLASCSSSNNAGAADAGSDADATAEGGGYDTSFAIPLGDSAGFLPDVYLDAPFPSDDGNASVPDANACVTIACPGTCTAGRCFVQLAHNGAYDLAVQAGTVYWTNPGVMPGGGSVLSIPSVLSSTTTAPTLLAAGQTTPNGIAVNATNLYWSNNSATAGAILSGPLSELTDAGTSQAADAGALTPTALASGQADPLAMAIDATNVYWVSQGSISAANGTVVKVPLNGGTPITLASGQSDPIAVAVDATNVYWIDLTAVGTNAYVGTVLKVPIAGGAVTTLAFGQSSPTAIAVDGTYVYWTQINPGAVVKAPVGGGSVITIAGNITTGTLGGLAVDSQNLYWSIQGQKVGAIVSSPLGGNTVVTLKGGLDYPRAMATDSTSIYWTDNIDGTVSKLTPK